ncbi:MAG: patatin-like phospholipase family protein [Nanoarchaeota archaeon]
MARDIVLYFGGGDMAGVFGAGVATRLQELDAYDQVKAVYGTSVGAFNGAYFLSRQTRLGSSIYYEDLNTGFIRPGKLMPLLSAILRHPDAIPEDADVMCIDKLIDVARHRKVLDTAAIAEQPIPFHVKTMVARTGTPVYHRFTAENAWDLLRATVCGAPYSSQSVEIDDREHIDAGWADPIGLAQLRSMHPDDHLVLVLNHPADRPRGHRLVRSAEAYLVGRLYGPLVAQAVVDGRRQWSRDLEAASKDGNVTIIAPDQNVPVNKTTTDPRLLIFAYAIGQQATFPLAQDLKEGRLS